MIVAQRIKKLLIAYDTLTMREIASLYNQWFGADYTPGQLHPYVAKATRRGELASYSQPRPGKPAHKVYFVPSHAK